MAVSTISGAIKWTGLSSGTDFGTVVSQLVKLEERVITRQETWQNEWKKKLTAITGLDTRLVALKLDAQSYNTRDQLLSRAGSSSDEKVATLTNLSTAPTGVFEVEVGQNIKEKIGSGSFLKTGPIGDDGSGEPLTIEMGGKTLTLTIDPGATTGDGGYTYRTDWTMEQLAARINEITGEAGYTGPNVSAEVIFDKDRSGDKYCRLVITGGAGGSANHITIKDPTDLGLDKKRFDEPVTASLVGSTARPVIATGSVYTGCGNKTITFVPTVTGTLGDKDIDVSWADTEGNRGTFTLKAADWDAVLGQMKEDVEVLQGLKLNFSAGVFIANEAFTIDCQAPVMQQAADSGLAATDKWIHRGFQDMTSPVTFGAAGKFDFSYAGMDYSVPVADGLGLSGLAEAINNYSKNPGVIASVINDGMGTATSYKLVLTGVDTGVEHGVKILGSTTLNRLDCSDGTFEHARWASNSMTRFDGYPNDGSSWLQRSTNEVGDVVDGAVVSLTGTGKTTLTIKNNVSDMATKIKSLVESVNQTKNYIKEQTKWGKDSKLVSKVLADGTLERVTEGGPESGVMIGNYGFQISLSDIDRLMTRSIISRDDFILAKYPDKDVRDRLSADEKKEQYDAYLETNGLIYTRLSDIGIASDHNQGGIYTVEESKLRECLTKNPEAVIKLFTFASKGTEIADIAPYADENTRPALSGFAVQLAYRMSDLTRTGDVIDPKTGDVIKPARGITKVLTENYSNIIKNIDDKIAREQKRIDLYRQRLELKFSRLETALSQLNNASESLASQLSQLNGSSS